MIISSRYWENNLIYIFEDDTLEQYSCFETGMFKVCIKNRYTCTLKLEMHVIKISSSTLQNLKSFLNLKILS